MAVKPIIFNTAMVQAILDNRKTVTRRAIKPKYKDGEYGWRVNRRVSDCAITGIEYTDEDGCGTGRHINPPYQPGDILYVRETWTKAWQMSNGEIIPWMGKKYVYKADGTDRDFDNDRTPTYDRWHLSIHMPKEAARIWLRVTGVRVERLQDMTPEDAIKEGVYWQDVIPSVPAINYPPYIDADAIVRDKQALEERVLLKESFGRLWDSTVKKKDLPLYGWEANPWVWKISFEKTQKPN